VVGHKCAQNHFAHHGGELYDELEHIRNTLGLASVALRFADDTALVHARQIDALAHVRRLLRVPSSAAWGPILRRQLGSAHSATPRGIQLDAAMRPNRNLANIAGLGRAAHLLRDELCCLG